MRARTGELRREVIEGYVTEVVDGDTFVLDVDRHARWNSRSYDDVERVRLQNVSAPELSTSVGRAALARLRARIQGRRVRVEIHARDRYGWLIGIARLA